MCACLSWLFYVGYMYVYICVCVCACVRACVCVFVHIYTCIHDDVRVMGLLIYVGSFCVMLFVLN